MKHTLAKPRTRTTYICRSCGAESAKWMGRCPECEAWNTLEEEVTAKEQAGNLNRSSTMAQPIPLAESLADSEVRRSLGFPEFDRVLGGGVVAGSLILLGGDPGVGKSTLLLQAAHRFSRKWGSVLYVSAEESARQVQLRAARLGVLSDKLYVLSENDIEVIINQIIAMRPELVIIDSIQTVASPQITSVPGSVNQTRACTHEVMQVAKALGIPVFLVGHVNKSGALAGPKVLEHAVDVVLAFEGERHTPYRLLRAVKNRYGSTHELGVYTMEGTGLVEVSNPSAFFLAERPEAASGSVIVACMEGTQPLLVEIQALVSTTPFGGTPRRQASGVDRNRVSIVLAVLEKRANMPLQTCDVYINVAGGLTVDEPAVDLGIACAVASSLRGVPVNHDTVVFGEIGLAGELRSVRYSEKRIAEAEKLGFTKCVLPNATRIRQPVRMTLEPAVELVQALNKVLA
jgi:DNA repair protein RadA/Sms